MSVTNYKGEKIVLTRTGMDAFWKLIKEHYAQEHPRKWKYLAILALRENAGWELEQIGYVFGHPKGHITRCLRRIKQELAKRFEADWNLPLDEMGEIDAWNELESEEQR